MTKSEYAKQRYAAIKADPARYGIYLERKLAEQRRASPVRKVKYADRYRVNRKRRRVILRDWLGEYLRNHPCVDCGEGDPVVLEFDHVRGKKTADVCQLVQRRMSLVAVQTEVDKCEVRCANCHRRVTHNRRKAQCTETRSVEKKDF